MKLTYHLMWICLVVYLALYTTHQFNNYQEAKGVAISNYLSHYQNIDIPPEQAMYFTVNMNQWDIQIDDLQIFGSWENGKKKNGGKW